MYLNVNTDQKIVMFNRHYDTPEELATKSLSDYTVSSTVTCGPIADLLKLLLESLNKACLAGQPETVEELSDFILTNGLTVDMEISKMEIILANTRAVTLLDPTVSIKDHYESLVNKYYKAVY